jgi:DNA-binding transcriptional ArsR family regulator
MTDYSMPGRFDRMIHNPGRLAIMAVLAGCERADFTYLAKATELNKGTLSKHLSTLEDYG